MKQSRRLFDTSDDSAIYFAKNYTELSQQSENEYGAVIYRKRKDARYYLGKIHIGNSKHVLMMYFESVISLLIFKNIAGTIHTHTRAYKTKAPNNWNCGFSFWDNFLINRRYLCAPNGVLYKSDNHGKNRIVIKGLSTSGSNVSDDKIYTNQPLFKTNKKRNS